jgi:NAD-dependent DNA ligase
MRVNEFTNLADIAQVMEIQGVLTGKRICITGHLGRPRIEIIRIIEMAGGEFHDTIRPTTSYLLTNSDWNAGSTAGKVSSKFARARKNGVKIIDEKQFYDMLCGTA